jgi:uncharacterized protein
MEEGTITNKWSGTRVFLFGSIGWAHLRSDIESTYYEEGLMILHRLGLSVGETLGTLALQRSMDSQKFVQTLMALSRNGGWGNLTLVSGDPVAGRWQVRQENCVFCSHLPHIGGKPSCEFLAGVLKGSADAFLQRRHFVKEVECTAAGDSWCEFYLWLME